MAAVTTPLECRRGEPFQTLGSSAGQHLGIAWKETDRIAALPKAEARRLRREGLFPDPQQLLCVRMRPGEATEWTLNVEIQFATKPAETREFRFQRQPDKLDANGGHFDALFTCVHGPHAAQDFDFPQVFELDVSDGGTHAPSLVVTGLGSSPVPVQLGPADDKLLECVCVPGVTFGFDQSFIRPSVMPHLRALDAALQQHPEARLFILAHTDRVSTLEYNKDLSDRRAESTFAFITDDADTWETLYQREQWGLKVVQEILLDLGHDPGPIDGLIGPRTRAAMQSFAGAPVQNDASFRKKLFLAYMQGKHDIKATPDQFMEPKFAGCSEINPIAPPNQAELENRSPGNEPNRRVIIYLFREDLPQVPCKVGDLRPCQEQIAVKGGRQCFPCDFYDDIATRCSCECADKKPKPKGTGQETTLTVRVTRDGAPAVGADVVVQGPSGVSGTTGADGSVVFKDLTPGSYVALASQDALAGTASIELAEGERETVTIELEEGPPLPPPPPGGGTNLVVLVTLDGVPAPAASVQVFKLPERSTPFHEGTTGPDGTLRIPGVEPAQYIAAAAQRAVFSQSLGTVQDGTTKTITVRLTSEPKEKQPARLTVRVLDVDGNPAGGSFVSVDGPDKKGPQSAPDGTTKFTLQPGQYTVRAERSSPGEQPEKGARSIDLSEGQVTTLEVVLGGLGPAGASMKVTVITADGPTTAEVNLEGPTERGPQTAEGGVTTFPDILPGQYVVRATKIGAGQKLLTGFNNRTVKAGEAAEAVVLLSEFKPPVLPGVKAGTRWTAQVIGGFSGGEIVVVGTLTMRIIDRDDPTHFGDFKFAGIGSGVGTPIAGAGTSDIEDFETERPMAITEFQGPGRWSSAQAEIGTGLSTDIVTLNGLFGLFGVGGIQIQFANLLNFDFSNSEVIGGGLGLATFVGHWEFLPGGTPPTPKNPPKGPQN